MNEIEKAINILVDSDAENHYTKDEIALAYLLAIKALREMEYKHEEGAIKDE